MKRYEALQYIDQVHKKIKYKAVENQRVKKGNDGPRLQHRALGKDDPERAEDTLPEIVKTRIRFATRAIAL